VCSFHLFLQIVQTSILETEVVKSELSDALTIVTAYFSIGKFSKGSEYAVRKPATSYLKWINAFSRLDSPVVAFFDTDYAADAFRRLRRNLPTLIRKVNRSEVNNIS